MDIRALLIQEHSKKRAQFICDGIIDGQADLKDLIEMLYTGDLRMRQKASWPLELLAKKKGALLHPYIPEIVEVLSHSTEDSFTRNVYRILQHMTFDSEHLGPVYEVAYTHLSNPKNAIAVRVFAMSTCANIAQQYPDLAHELIPLIESYYPTGSSGYKARANKELKRLNKLID